MVFIIFGDDYAGEWPKERFSTHGVTYQSVKKPRSDIYKEFAPLLRSQKVQLLDNSRMISQIHELERRVAPGGRDVINHAPNCHDDCANSCAGTVVLASAHTRKINFHVPTVASRAEYMADFVASIFDPAGGGSAKPGGWEFGDPRADPYAHLSWSSKPQ
jgi:hypothetical protein